MFSLYLCHQWFATYALPPSRFYCISLSWYSSSLLLAFCSCFCLQCQCSWLLIFIFSIILDVSLALFSVCSLLLSASFSRSAWSPTLLLSSSCFHHALIISLIMVITLITQLLIKIAGLSQDSINLVARYVYRIRREWIRIKQNELYSHCGDWLL